MTRWLVDGTNVVGARPDGWWRDRSAAFARLVERLAALVVQGGDVTVVFDGRAPEELAEGGHAGVSVLWARRGGPDAADDRIVEVVKDDVDPATLTVATSDRALARRVGELGAEVVGAGTLLRLLDAVDPA